MTRNQKILALVGQKSFGLIARELGITRNVVAGVVFRARWPLSERVPSPGYGKQTGGGNKCGLGHHGAGEYAPENLMGPR